MNKNRLLYRIFSIALWGMILVLEGIRAKRSGDFGLFATTIVFTAAAIGVLLAIERFLARKKSPAWMSRFHIGLAVAFAATVAILIVYLLSNLA